MLLSRKLPLSAAFLTLLSIAITSSLALYIGTNSLSDTAFEKLSAVADGRRNQLEAHLTNIHKDLVTTASGRDAQSAAAAFTKAFGAIKGDRTKELQERYILKNPNPTGKKHLLASADVDTYDKLHKRYHPRFLEMLELHGYYDIFLIDLDGNIVYSVFKELDYATNLKSGKWKGSDLAGLYKDAMASENLDQVFFKDYKGYEPSYGAAASFIGKAIQFNGKRVGTLVFQMPSGLISEVMNNKTGLGATGESILLNGSGMLITDSSFSEIDDILTTSIDSSVVLSAVGNDVTTARISQYRNMESMVALAPLEFDGVRWFVASLISEDEAKAGIISMRNGIIATAIVLFLLSIAVSTWFARTITKPIDNVLENMSKLAAGNTEFEMTGQSRKDEIGKMVEAVDVFRTAAIEKTQLEIQSAEQRQLSRSEQEGLQKEKEAANAIVQDAMNELATGLNLLAGGDLTAAINKPFEGELDTLRLNFNQSVETLKNAMLQISDNTNSISANSSEMRSAADNLAKRTEEQAASLEESSSALEEITATVKETSSQANEAAKVAEEAKDDANSSSQIVEQAVGAMAEIENSSGEISNIIHLIDEIAFQTNLLALNAGVEAARAGEAGRGFAVVAEEVRELAQRSASAAKDIQELITASSTQVTSGVSLVNQAGESLHKISEHVNNINTRIASIARASGEQLTGIQEVNLAVNQMDQVTQQNAAMVEESTAVTHKMSEEVSELSALIGNFKIGQQPAGGVAPRRDFAAQRPEPASARPAVARSQPAPPPRASKPAVSRPAVSGNNALKVEIDAGWEEF